MGADAHSRARQATSTAAYTSRKEMVTMLAMVLSFPENSTSWKVGAEIRKAGQTVAQTHRHVFALLTRDTSKSKDLNLLLSSLESS